MSKNGHVVAERRRDGAERAQGALQPNGTFSASEVLAKHDENYMPPEVADALKKSGHWKEKQGKMKR